MDKPTVIIFDPQSNPTGFSYNDFSKSSSPTRTIEEIVNLLNDIANNDKFVIRRIEYPKLPLNGDPVRYDVLWRSNHQSMIISVHLSKHWPVEIHDTGQRQRTRLSVARARKKIESGGWDY